MFLRSNSEFVVEGVVPDLWINKKASKCLECELAGIPKVQSLWLCYLEFSAYLFHIIPVCNDPVFDWIF